MHFLIVPSSLTLAFVAFAILRRQPTHYTNAKAVGLLLLAGAEVLLFRERWWWGLLGLLVPPFYFGFRGSILRPTIARPLGPTGEENTTLIDKEEVDAIFGLNRGGWNARSKLMAQPDGWEIRILESESGNVIMARDTRTGVGLGTQPLFSSDDAPPELLVVTTYHPAGALRMDERCRREMEAAAQTNLGAGYVVSLGMNEVGDDHGLIASRITVRKTSF